MSVQLCSIPRSNSYLRSRTFIRIDVSPHASICAGWKLCGLTALAVAVMWGGHPGSAMAQATPVPTVPASTAAPVTSTTTETTSKRLFEHSSGWDAPEPWRTDQFYFQFAYYTWHFHYDADHKQSYMFDAEYHYRETWLGGQWIMGVALFQNSFGQFSQYVFAGLQWRPIEDHQPFYVKVTVGPLHGYSGQYKNKVPFNNYGVAPAIIPSVGYCVQRYCGEFVLLGAAGALFTIGVTLP